MSGPDGQVHRGWRRHMRWALESSWGVLPGEPDWRSVPIRDGVMDLAAAAALFAPETAYGGYRRSVLLPELVEVAGPVETLAWPEVTEYLLDAALARNANPASDDYQELPSYSVDFYAPPDPRRCSGCVVESLALRAEPDAVALRLHLRAGSQAANGSLSAEDFDYSGLSPVPFRLRGAEVTLEGEGAADVEAFTLTVRNEVAAGPNVGGAVAWLAAAGRTVRLALTKLHAFDLFNDAVRDGTPLSFAATFSHPEGHEMSLSLPVLYAASSAEKAPPERLARTGPVLEAAVDESGDDLTYSVTLA